MCLNVCDIHQDELHYIPDKLANAIGFWSFFIFFLFLCSLWESLHSVIVSIFHNELHAMQSQPTPPNNTELFGAFPFIWVFNYNFATKQAFVDTFCVDLPWSPDYGRLLFWIANSIASKRLKRYTSTSNDFIRFSSLFLTSMFFFIHFCSFCCFCGGWT